MPKINTVMDENEVVKLGASLRAIDQKLLKRGHDSNTIRIWFQGDEPYFDVFFELKNNEIIWFQFTLRGKSLSWDKKRPGMQTGSTNEFRMDDVTYYPASKTIETDSKPDVEFINFVKSILETRAEEEIFTKALALFSC